MGHYVNILASSFMWTIVYLMSTDNYSEGSTIYLPVVVIATATWDRGVVSAPPASSGSLALNLRSPDSGSGCNQI